MCAYISMEDKTKYYLVDLSKLPARGFAEYEATEGYYSNGEFLEYEYGDYSIWDFDFTILTDDALLCEADYIGFGNEIYWLISQNEKWGYIRS